MEKIELLINKDQLASFEKAADYSSLAVVRPAYKSTNDPMVKGISDMYITIEAALLTDICRLCFLAGYYEKGDQS